jgi:hypothetical protein
MRRAIATALLIMAAASFTACGSSVDSAGGNAPAGSDVPTLSTGEALFLDTVKGRTSPDWAPWPSDSVLLDQGYQICELLRMPGLMRAAIVYAMDPIPSNMGGTQGEWEINAAESTIC